MKTGLVTLRADIIPHLFKASYCTIGLSSTLPHPFYYAKQNTQKTLHEALEQMATDTTVSIDLLKDNGRYLPVTLTYLESTHF